LVADKLEIPADVGIMNWDWLGDWQLENDTNVYGKKGNAYTVLMKIK
jgi:hypothetical protein